MNYAVRYYSKTGNTKKLAEAAAAELKVEARDVSAPLEGHTDVLFLCSSVYAAGVADEIKQFIAGLKPETVARVVCLSTAALLPSTYKQVSGLLAKRGITVDAREFHCRGQFHILHRGKPDENDLKAAREFVRSAANG